MATETKRVYDIQINGTDSFNELKQAVEQLNEKLKTLNETSKEYKDTLAQLTDYQSKLADAMKGISDAAATTKTSMTDVKDTISGVTEGMTEASTAATQMNSSLSGLSGGSTIKELKADVKLLKDELYSLEIGSERYNEVSTQLANTEATLKSTLKGVKTSVQAAQGSYDDLSNTLIKLTAEYHSTNDEARKNELAPQIAEIRQQLKDMDAAVLVYGRNVGNYSSALDGLDASFVSWKQELKECKEAMQQLDPASEAYNEAMTRAAEITHQLSEQQEMIKYSSKDVGDQLNNIKGIASNLAAGYSAVNAAMGLFGEENEEVQQAMLKVQQAMALVQGLQGIDGFIKRTKGLSQSLGLATKATQANTVATKANAAAAKADAVAMGAETVATKAAVPAQLSLNAAMKANPIGFIIGLIATLVTAMMLLKDKIMEMIGSNKEMSAAFDKVKAVLAGFGNIIKKSIINPIKLAIIPIKTLAKVMIDVFKGDWSKIGDDIKAGFEETKDVVVDTINVVGAFKEGYDKKTAEQNEAARKAEAAARQKELDNIIKDNEAKYGSDWKYTEEAKKLYEEMFKMRLAQYGQDSDEYREAQRDKLAYDREFQEKQDEASKKAADDEKKRQEQAAKEAKQRRDKMLSDFKSAFSKYLPEMLATSFNYTDLYDKWLKGVDLFKNELIKKYKLTAETANAIIEEMQSKFLKAMVDDVAKTLKVKLDKEIYNIDRTLSAKLREITTKYNYDKLVIGIEFPQDELRHFNDIYVETMHSLRKELKLTNDDIDTVLTEILQNGSNSMINILGKDVYESIQDQITEVIKMYADYYEAVNNGNTKLAEELLKNLKESDTTKAVEEAFGLSLPEFQKLLDERNNLIASMTQAEIENYKSVMDIRKRQYELAEKKETTYYENSLKRMELNYAKEEALIEKRNQWFYSGNEIEALKRETEYENEYYKTVIEMYQKLRDRYIEMSNDMKLSADERKNAEIAAAKITGEIIEEEMNHQTQLLKIQKDNIKAWQNAVKDAVSGVANILGTLGDSWSSLIELEKAEIAQQLENGEINEDEAKRREAANEESFKNLKKLQIAQSIINTLAAAVSAYQSMASIPYVGPVLGAAAAAAALAAGYAQVRQIQATNYNSGSSSIGGGGGSSSATFQLPNVMELEPNQGRNITNMNNVDELNNDGSGGRGKTVIKTYVLESDINAAQQLALKRSNETTF